jgi:hypothetical protein
MHKRKQIFQIGNRPYELIVVSGPIYRENRVVLTQFDHEKRVLRISSVVPIEDRAWAVAVAVSDACFRLWRPIPVVWPRFPIVPPPFFPPAPEPPRPGLADDPPHA